MIFYPSPSLPHPFYLSFIMSSPLIVADDVVESLDELFDLLNSIVSKSSHCSSVGCTSLVASSSSFCKYHLSLFSIQSSLNPFENFMFRYFILPFLGQTTFSLALSSPSARSLQPSPTFSTLFPSLFFPSYLHLYIPLPQISYP